MKLPRTTILAAGATTGATAVIAQAQAALNWSGVQTTAVTGLAVALIAFLAFVIEHVRKETPSRWVGVIGLAPSVIVAGYTVAAVFGWFGIHDAGVSGFTVGVYSLFTPLGSLLGVTVVQGKVTSPETLAAELKQTAVTVAAAQAAGPNQAR